MQELIAELKHRADIRDAISEGDATAEWVNERRNVWVSNGWRCGQVSNGQRYGKTIPLKKQQFWWTSTWWCHGLANQENESSEVVYAWMHECMSVCVKTLYIQLWQWRDTFNIMREPPSCSSGSVWTVQDILYKKKCMFVCVHVYVCVFMYSVCTYIQVYLFVCTYISTYTCVCVCVCVYIYQYT